MRYIQGRTILRVMRDALTGKIEVKAAKQLAKARLQRAMGGKESQ